METTKRRIRRDYAPLNVAVSLTVATPGSLPMQVYNSDIQQFEPDRQLTPCVILPVVVMHAKDGSWNGSEGNGLLSEIKWILDGKDISSLKEWNGMYSIDLTEGAFRGSITIRKNIMPGTVHSLRMEAVVADPRTGVNIPINSEEVNLSTNDKTDDEYSMSISDSQVIRYNPFLDKLFLYEYQAANGMVQASEAARSAAMDENSYICEIPVTLYKGNKVKASGYDLKLYHVLDSAKLIEITAADKEVTSISPTKVILDLRLITKEDFLIRLFVDGKQVGQEQFSVNRVFPKFTCRPTNGTSVAPNDIERYDVAMVDSEGNKIECPEAFLRILWKTDTEAKKEVIHNEGRDTVFLLSKTGIGNTYLDDWLDVYTEAEHKPAMSVATDESGNIYTDENDNPLIFN